MKVLNLLFFSQWTWSWNIINQIRGECKYRTVRTKPKKTYEYRLFVRVNMWYDGHIVGYRWLNRKKLLLCIPYKLGDWKLYDMFKRHCVNGSQFFQPRNSGYMRYIHRLLWWFSTRIVIRIVRGFIITNLNDKICHDFQKFISRFSESETTTRRTWIFIWTLIEVLFRDGICCFLRLSFHYFQ